MLKNVVLPAPFGPIRLTIERSGMSKSTRFTATNRSPHGVPTAGILVVQLLGALPVGDDALRPEEHHQDEHNAEDKETVLWDVHGGQRLVSDGLADRVHPSLYLRQKVKVGPLYNDGAQNDAVDVAHAAEDDHEQDKDGDVERETRRKYVLYKGPVESPREPTKSRP